MIKREAGFTLIELLITMVVFVLVIAAGSQIFSGLLTQFKQQSKIAETNMEGIVGLDMLRRDLEHAGYGLPWNIPSGTTYSEATSTTVCGSVDPSNYNEATVSSTTNPPRGIVSGNGSCTNPNSSDYLVIKAVNVATNNTSSKWTELIYASSCTAPYSNFAPNVCKRTWASSTEDLSNNDNVIAIYPGATSSTERLLKANSGAFSAVQFDSIPSTWLPTNSTDDSRRIVYGLNNGDAPTRPFNRGDYYISTSSVPQRCAPNTGVLVKAVMDYNGGFNQLPLLDCVADMQVIYCLDNDNDGDCEVGVSGSTDSYSDDISTQNAQWIRERVKQVRVYILAHEGQYDRNYTFNNFTCGANCITVGEFGLGRNFNLAASIGGNWQNYRWKVYTLVVKPQNLM